MYQQADALACHGYQMFTFKVYTWQHLGGYGFIFVIHKAKKLYVNPVMFKKYK